MGRDVQTFMITVAVIWLLSTISVALVFRRELISSRSKIERV
jgi:hypothetical protein